MIHMGDEFSLKEDWEPKVMRRCAWCKKEMPEKLVQIPDTLKNPISHTMCPECELAQ